MTPPKSTAQIKAEYDQDRELYGKPFYHRETREDYQLLFPAWDPATDEKQAVYVLSSMSWLKHTMPFEDFKEQFAAGRAVEVVG